MPSFRLLSVACALLIFAAAAPAAEPVLPPSQAYQTPDGWRQPVAPFRIAEHTWYIGTAGLSALLVKTPEGAVLIDGGLPQAADMLLARMRELGVAPDDLKLILHSHAHGDHAGPLAAVQRATGARVVSNAESAALLARGGSDDLHFGDGIAVTRRARRSPGAGRRGRRTRRHALHRALHARPHARQHELDLDRSMRDGKPLRIAYVDSLSAPGYQLIDNPRYPHIVDDYRRSFAAVRALPCDLLITPHPDASGWAPADHAAAAPVRRSTCRAYADAAEGKLDAQLDSRTQGRGTDAVHPDRRHPRLRALARRPRSAAGPPQRARRRRTTWASTTAWAARSKPTRTCVAGMRREIHEEAGIDCERAVAARHDQLARLRQARRGLAGLRLRHHAASAARRSTATPKARWNGCRWTACDDLPMWEGDRQFLPLVFDADPRPFHGVMPYRDGRMLSWKYSRLT